MKRTKGKYIGYIITNIINGKEYVGISKYSAKHRLHVHITDAVYHIPKYKSCLHNALNKYRKEAFKIKVLTRKNTWKEICDWEKKTIKERNSRTPNGYNLTDGGEGANGVIRTSEFKKKLSDHKKKFYSDPKKREEQGKRLREQRKDPKFREEQSKRSKALWKDPNYIEKVHQGNQMKRKKKKDSNHLPRNSEEDRKNRSNIIKKYWENGHNERKKRHAKAMSEMINKKLEDPEYQKWRKETPPGAKPVMYQFKYFRSIAEIAIYFNISRPKIDRDLLKQKPGCKRLDRNKRNEYNYEIKY